MNKQLNDKFIIQRLNSIIKPPMYTKEIIQSINQYVCQKMNQQSN